jgi:hypothetical protein
MRPYFRNAVPVCCVLHRSPDRRTCFVLALTIKLEQYAILCTVSLWIVYDRVLLRLITQNTCSSILKSYRSWRHPARIFLFFFFQNLLESSLYPANSDVCDDDNSDDCDDDDDDNVTWMYQSVKWLVTSFEPGVRYLAGVGLAVLPIIVSRAVLGLSQSLIK